MGKRLGGFLSQTGLILVVDSNCSGGREKRPGCVKKLRTRIKPNFSGGIESSETSQPRRDRRSHFLNFWSCRPLRHWELPVAGSHWPSGTTDLDGQLTENSEEPEFSPIPPFAPRRRTVAQHLSVGNSHLRVTGSSGAMRRVAVQVPEPRFSHAAIFTSVARPSPQR